MMDNTASTGQLFPGLTGCQTCSGIKVCWDWPAVFSTNNRREIWPFVTNGYTPEENRKQVRGESRVIDALRETYNRKAIPMCSWQSIKDIFCVFPDFLNQVWEAISRSK